MKSSIKSRIGAITLRETPHPNPDPEQVKAALLRGIEEVGIAALPWLRTTKQLRARMMTMHELDPSWPDVSDHKLLATLNEWLGPYLDGIRSIADLKRVRLDDALMGLMKWDLQRQLDQLVPTHYIVPSGSKIPIDYSTPSSPSISVRLQEVFGLKVTPKIAGGRLPIVFHLLSPAHRPLQITKDLESFWETAYFEIKKELKGRYPKHYWPDHPYDAIPTNRVKPR